MKPISAYRAKLYRLIFALAAIYNIAFGLWACLWPRAFFTSLAMAPPNYPGLWQCLGMVVGLYGVLYASAARHLEGARLIIAVGLAGKILGPIGLCLTIHSGEWPLRADLPGRSGLRRRPDLRLRLVGRGSVPVPDSDGRWNGGCRRRR